MYILNSIGLFAQIGFYGRENTLMFALLTLQEFKFQVLIILLLFFHK